MNLLEICMVIWQSLGCACAYAEAQSSRFVKIDTVLWVRFLSRGFGDQLGHCGSTQPDDTYIGRHLAGPRDGVCPLASKKYRLGKENYQRKRTSHN